MKNDVMLKGEACRQVKETAIREIAPKESYRNRKAYMREYMRNYKTNGWVALGVKVHPSIRRDFLIARTAYPNTDWSTIVGACIRSTIRDLAHSGNPMDGIP